jgi:RecB family endonuclease NucS
LATEEQIESAVESAPELLGTDVLIVGRQTPTPSGPLDLLAINGDGRLVVIENKRERTPREVLAQTIDYAAWVNTLTFDEVETIYANYHAVSANECAYDEVTAALAAESVDGVSSASDDPAP